MAVSFIQNMNMLSYSGIKCLRKDYAHNDCSLCFEICPEDALQMVRGKYTIMDNCTACAACLGVCPTEALTLENFDPNSFVLGLTEKEDKLVSCKGSSECLSAFDIAHYVTMALRNETAVTCDLSHCTTCEMNKENKIHDEIEGKIFLANNYLEQMGLEQRIEVKTQKEEEKKPSRFTMFKQAHGAVAEVSQAGATEMFAAEKSPIPLKMFMMKNALREKMRDIPNTKIKNTLLFTQQEIDFEKCTFCKDCITFCPTKALSLADDQQGINFKGGHCISCGICHDTCKDDAISAAAEIDIITMIYDRTEELVHYEMAMCMECKCAYPYKGGEQICDRCSQFGDDHEGLFTLARDM